MSLPKVAKSIQKASGWAIQYPSTALETGLKFAYVRPTTEKETGPLETNKARLTKDGIRIYEANDFAGMAKAGALAAKILDDIAAHVFPGQTTGRTWIA